MPKSIHRPEYEQLRKLVREVRIDAGVTQETLSVQLGRSQSFVSDIERGVRRIDAIELRDLCHLLGIDLAHFLGVLEERIAVGKGGLRRTLTVSKKSTVRRRRP